MKKDIIEVKNVVEFGDRLNGVNKDKFLKKSLVVYCRVSTKQQIKSNSLNDQRDKGIEFFQNDKQFNDYENILVLREEGKSGDDYNEDDNNSLVKRQLFTLILNNLKHIKHIWVLDSNRLCRNSMVMGTIVKDFRNHKVMCYINGVKKDMESDDNRFYIQLMGIIDEIENEKRFQRGLMGKLTSIRSGKWWGGRYQYGYRKGKMNGEILIDEIQSITVVNIFNLYKNGKSLKDIIIHLQINNIKSPISESGEWNRGTLRNMLRNQIYIGKKTYVVKLRKDISKERCIELGEYEKVDVINLPKIIDDNLFYDVQRLMSEQNVIINKKRNTKYEYLLSHKLYCGNCNNTMKTVRDLKRNINVYRCNYVEKQWNYVSDKHLKCGRGFTKSVNINVVEKLVWDEIVNTFKNSYIIKEQFKTDYLSIKYKERDEPLNRIDDLKVEIENCNKRIKIINERKNEFLSKWIIDEMEESVKIRLMREVDGKIKIMNNKLSQLELEIINISDEVKWYDWLIEFDKKYDDIKDLVSIEDKRKFIDECINKIDVCWDSITKTHTIKVYFKLNIVKDIREKIGRYKFKVSEGLNVSEISNIKSNKLCRKIKNEKPPNTVLSNHSTVTLLARLRG